MIPHGPCRAVTVRWAAALLLVVGAGLGCQAAGDAVWFVRATAEEGGAADGSRERPFSSLAQAEAASAPGDEIRILAPVAEGLRLEGGLKLQPRQTLRAEDASFPEVTHGSGDRGGDVITLAEGSVVEGLHLVAAAGHAIVARNVHGTRVAGNRISGANTADQVSVSTGATAGLGVPAFPKSAVAFVHDDGEGAAGAVPAANVVSDNVIQGLPDTQGGRLGGAGIALHARGTARAVLEVRGNRVADLGPGFPRSGILVDTQEQSRVHLEIEDTIVSGGYQSSDGTLIVAQHDSVLEGAIRRYEYRGGGEHQGLGNNGLEVAVYFGGDWLSGPSEVTGAIDVHRAQMRLVLEESTLQGSAGFGLVVLNMFGKPSSDTVLDFGAGELGGKGGNRVFGNGSDLPVPLEVFLVHHDLEMPNAWWGVDPEGRPKAVATEGRLALRPELAFLCPGTPGQLDTLIRGTGTQAWSMFCQTYRGDVCRAGAAEGCCDPTADPERCLMSPALSSLATAPALSSEPSPEIP